MAQQIVLVIEDDAAIRQGLVDALQYEGYATLEADNGEDGLRLATTGTYDLLLLDLVLPGVGGLDILKETRAVRPALPVIILSWPAHEICLVFSGLGFGYNAKCPANAWSFTVFLAQALVTWVFVLVPIVQQKKVWTWLAAQLMLLLILFCTFWYYGRG